MPLIQSFACIGFAPIHTTIHQFASQNIKKKYPPKYAPRRRRILLYLTQKPSKMRGEPLFYRVLGSVTSNKIIIF
jgi:hypothetical protein